MRIGIDIGGTFTDFVFFDESTGQFRTFKLLSTPSAPEEAVLVGLNSQSEIRDSRFEIIHGSTVATNALLERKGARTTFIATRGFKDILTIGRQNRSAAALYDFFADRPAPLIPPDLCFEISERVDHQGRVLQPLVEAELPALVGQLRAVGAEMVAICLLFSFLHPAHEQTVAAYLRDHGFLVSASSDILPEFREYERASTTAINAYVSPVMERYLGRLERGLAEMEEESADYADDTDYLADAWVDQAKPKNHIRSRPLSSASQTPEKAADAADFADGLATGEIDPLDNLRTRPRSSASQTPEQSAASLDKHDLSAPSAKSAITFPPSLRIMQSNGGMIRADIARTQAVRCILSGPAGGAVGALQIARTAGHERIMAFDMGGTSTDVSLLDGRLPITSEAEIGGLPLRIPVIDIHTVGAGGGSIAQVDVGGSLRVGPHSAGANPGPACYGRGGTQTTVTDANLILGRIPSDHFLGGTMRLDVAAAESTLTELAQSARLQALPGLTLAQTAALGVVQIANAHMERALRVISVERGYDPADFTLLSFGGAGGLHACALARDLGMTRVLAPPQAAVLSAFGMLAADVVKDYVQTVMVKPPDLDLTVFESLSGLAETELLAEGVPAERIELRRQLDMRYVGQSFELTIPFTSDFIVAFHAEHARTYGHAEPTAAVEIVNIRLRAEGRVDAPPLVAAALGDPDPSPALFERQPVVLASGQRIRIPFYDGRRLHPGHVIPGPAIIVQPDTTLFLPDDAQGQVDGWGNFVIVLA